MQSALRRTPRRSCGPQGAIPDVGRSVSATLLGMAGVGFRRECPIGSIDRPDPGRTGAALQRQDSLPAVALCVAVIRVRPQGSLAPGDRHGGCPPVSVLTLVRWPFLEPTHKPDELLHGFLIGLSALFRAGQLRLAQDPAFGIATGPGNLGGRPLTEQVHIIEWTFLFIEGDTAVLDLVLAHIVAIEIEIQQRLQLAGMGTATWKPALPPARE